MTNNANTTILVIAKEPIPGKVKTRLSPQYTQNQAAEFAQAALLDTLHTVLRCPAKRRVLALDGNPGSWLPNGFDVIKQHGDGLDERIANAFDATDGPTLLLGMDTPQVTINHLTPALAPDAWNDCDAWFGPAFDGGFWALGLAKPSADLVIGVPMSRLDTGYIQRQRLVDAGLNVRDLLQLRDVDTADDARLVATMDPTSRFAAKVNEFRGDMN